MFFITNFSTQPLTLTQHHSPGPPHNPSSSLSCMPHLLPLPLHVRFVLASDGLVDRLLYRLLRSD